MRARIRDILGQLRPAHWVKNIVVLVPLFVSGQLLELALWPAVIMAFGVFCLASSAGYQLNDLVDLEADRAEPRKRHRPLAGGFLSRRTVVFLGLVCALSAAALAFYFDRYFAWLIVGYMALSALYSLVLKRFAIILSLSTSNSDVPYSPIRSRKRK